jgi:hypothetical protein
MKSKNSFLLTMIILIAIPCLNLGADERTISLDGDWQIIFDPYNRGRTSGWFKTDGFTSVSSVRTIPVPGAWELIEEDYEGVAFYRRDFHVPKTWEDKVVRLQFGAVNHLTEVWLNDKVVGWHEGGFTPFSFRMDEMLKPGEDNVLILRVVGPIILSDQNIDGVGPMETPQWRGGITGGIWQSVKLQASDEVVIKDVFIQPKISNRAVDLQATLDHTGIKSQSVGIEIDIFDTEDSSTALATLREDLELHPGINCCTWQTVIPDAQLWSPNEPHLYRMILRVMVSDKESDRWTHRFGLRELTVKDKDFYLNGERIYLKACFFEGLYPNGIAAPDSEAMARREIQLAKEAGFNMIRPWRRPPVPRWLDLADEMGVLIVGSPALECMQLPLSTPYLPSRVENEIRQAVLRDRNRTCIVQWELFNELHRPVLKQMMRPMAMLTRNLDPTRLILDESGGWAFGANIYLPYAYEPTKFNDIHNYPGPFINEHLYNGFLTIGMTEKQKHEFGFRGRTPGRNVVPGLMSFVSELGYGSLPNMVDNNKRFRQKGNPLTPAYRYHQRLAVEQELMLQESGFGDFYPDMQQFYLDQQAIHGAANKRMIEAVRSNPEVDGYCIHALVAGDWILGAGLLDLWRNPKSYAYEGTKAANQARILSIRTKPRNIYADKGTQIEITGINELKSVNTRLTIHIESANGETVFSKQLKTEWKSGVSRLFQHQLITRSLSGHYTIKARIENMDGTILTENVQSMDVFSPDDLEIPSTQVALLDSAGSLHSFFIKQGINFKEFNETTALHMPVFVTDTKTRNTKDQERFTLLLQYVQSGGTVVYIKPTEKRYQRGTSNEVKTPTYPFNAKVEAAQGLWTCIPHLVRDHPIFDGLPVNTMMHDLYENVWARQTLRDLSGETLVASIGFNWFSHDHKLHYSGPGESWWGADLALVSYGQGHCLLSQLRIIENLGKDPVADKILYNLIRYFTQDE